MTRSESIPTYEEIAIKAGVSIKTVCNVFRYPDIVRQKTGEKVLKALRELGVKDPAAMKTRLRPPRLPQTKSIMFLESGLSLGALNSPVFSKIIHVAENHAHEMGWQFNLHYKTATESLSDALRNFHGEGVILFGKETAYEELRQSIPGIAAVRLLMRPDSGSDCDNVDYDRMEVSRLAAQHLREKGCRKVAFLGGLDMRGRMFLAFAQELGMQAVDGMVDGLFVSDGSTQVVSRTALDAGWDKIAAAHPDGIFVQSDQVTNALYGLLAERGIRPQRDIQVVSCNAEELFLGPLTPRPATIDIHSPEIGRRGVDMLIWRIQNREAPPCSVIIRPKLIPGEVCQ